MDCPKCKVKISVVYIISDYTQVGHLIGNKIVDTEELKHTGGISKTKTIICPICEEDITEFIIE